MELRFEGLDHVESSLLAGLITELAQTVLEEEVVRVATVA